MEKRTRNIFLGLFGLGASCVVVACAVAFLAPQAVLYLTGFGTGEDTAEILGGLSDGGVIVNEGGDVITGNPLSTKAIAPTPVVVVQELNQVTVQLDGQSQTVDLDTLGVDQAVQGATEDGDEVYYFEYDEISVNEMFNTVLWPNAPIEATSQINNIVIDLKPNAVVLSGDANLGFGIQPVSVILGIDASNARFAVVGMELNGLVFETPPNGPIGESVTFLETEGNRALDELVLFGSDGSPLSIKNLAVEDGRLRITAGQ